MMRRTVVFLMTLGLASALHADIIHIPDDFETIQGGIDASEDGDTVLVQPGVYVENIDFGGHRIVLGSHYLTTEDTSYIDSTIIDGDNSSNVLSFMNEEPEGTEVCGFIIRNGRAQRWDIDDRHWYYAGGGVYSVNASPTFRHCILMENEVVEEDGMGGGVYLDGGTAGFFGCVFTENIDGGGLYAKNTTITIRRCRFLSNSYGASIDRSTVTIQNCSFQRNDGSGLGIGSSTVTIEECSFQGNDGCGLGIGGCRGGIDRCSFVGNAGGIRSGGNHDLTLEYCLFEENDSFEGGGIFFSGGGSMTVSGCTFRNNHAQFGGAVSALHGAQVTLEHCVLVGNSAGGWGGGLYGRDRVELDIINCTLYGNSADQGGGAVGANWGFSPLLKNSILYENGEHQIYCVPSGNGWATLFVMYSLIQGGRDGVALNNAGEIERWDENIDADPLFVDPEEGDFRLTADSPCIDAGDPESDLDPDGTRADMGAFHYHQRDIEVEPGALDFVGVLTGTTDSLALNIRNLGLTPLTVTDIFVDPEESPFAVDWNDTLTLEPESETERWVYFSPDEESEYRAELRVISDDFDEDTGLVALTGIALGVERSEQGFPAEFAITGVHPNPFNSAVTVTYSLPRASNLRLTLIDGSGRTVGVLGKRWGEAGRHTVSVDASALTSGIYFVRLETAGSVSYSKLVCVR